MCLDHVCQEVLSSLCTRDSPTEAEYISTVCRRALVVKCRFDDPSLKIGENSETPSPTDLKIKIKYKKRIVGSFATKSNTFEVQFKLEPLQTPKVRGVVLDPECPSARGTPTSDLSGKPICTR